MKMQILAVLFFMLFSTPILSPQTTGITEGEMIQIKKTNDICQLRNTEFTPENLKEYLKLRDVENPLIVYKQAILETGWFTSGSFKEGSNVLGMKKPKIRETLIKDELYGHGALKHWTESIDDYLMWQEYWKSKGYDLDNYYVFLKKVGYAEDRYYVNKLKRIII